MSVRTVLLEHENKRLKEALVNEKKKRQRGKPLLLEAPTEYDGGAIFWSLKKSLEKKEKAEKRAKKERMLEERKRTHVIAKEIKLHTQAEKQLQKLAKKTPAPRKNTSKNKGKPKAITIESSTDEEELDEASDEEVSLMEMGAATPARSRRSRNINLPTRFRN
ncbi:hypothetical protein P154DRAFT_535206 [Amniculicola lignicola CBS 123094]|uniref:Uncharacterized protein n=1 Tax=Amniculicola lignicola CBS 123094 TaxID=1392246 RepID=A0A6A5WKR8_9PLEO|nr:hypothetical protein P154DRAFT_535206 [Amniculicola lignicola CBS 123094]